MTIYIYFLESFIFLRESNITTILISFSKNGSEIAITRLRDGDELKKLIQAKMAI